MSDLEETERQCLIYIRKHHALSLPSIRCGLADASALCDAIARDIERAHTTRGKVTKKGKELAVTAKDIGTAIWSMRQKLYADE